MRTLHNPMNNGLNLPVKAQTDAPIRRRLFETFRDYANVSSSDSSLSDLTSIASSYSLNEGGYSSDVSDVVLSFRRESSVNKKRRKRLLLDPSKMESLSDNEEPAVTFKKPIRKHKKNKPKNTNNSHDYKQVDGHLIYAEENVVKERRLSLTDSGVSLSRTDQSQCGTMKKENFPKPAILSESGTGIITSDDEDAESSLKETDPGESTTQECVEQDQQTSFYLKKERKSVRAREQCNINRLSLMTDKSSLTNVTILSSNSCSNSLCSLEEPTSTIYFTSETERQEDSDDEGRQSNRQNISDRVEHVITKSESAIYNTSTLELRSQNSNSDVRSEASSKSDHFEGRKRGGSLLQGLKKVKDHLKPKSKPKPYKDASAEFSYEKSQADKNRIAFEELTASVFGRSSKSETRDSEFKEFSQGIEQTRNYQCAEEHEVSSNEGIDSVRSEIVKTENPRKGSTFMEGSIEHDHNNDLPHNTIAKDPILTKPVDILEETFTLKKVSKQKRFLKKLFRRSSSKSFSAEKMVKKSLNNKTLFQRNGKDRSSVRSIPDNFGHTYHSSSNHNLKSKSLDHIDNSMSFIQECACDQQTNNRDSNVSQRRKSCPTEIDEHSRIRSSTSTSNDLVENQTKHQSLSTPNTPLMLRKMTSYMQMQDGVSNHTISHPSLYGIDTYKSPCDCEECLGAEYMEFLAFQQFKRAGGFHSVYGYQQPFNPYLMSLPPMQETQRSPTISAPSYMHHIMSRRYETPERTNRIIYQSSSNDTTVRENVVAPLSVTVEKDKKAVTLKTSMYDTFV